MVLIELHDAPLHVCPPVEFCRATLGTCSNNALDLRFCLHFAVQKLLTDVSSEQETRLVSLGWGSLGGCQKA